MYDHRKAARVCAACMLIRMHSRRTTAYMARLQVCNGVTSIGLATLAQLRRLRVLELSYTEVQVCFLAVLNQWCLKYIIPWLCLVACSMNVFDSCGGSSCSLSVSRCLQRSVCLAKSSLLAATL